MWLLRSFCYKLCQIDRTTKQETKIKRKSLQLSLDKKWKRKLIFSKNKLKGRWFRHFLKQWDGTPLIQTPAIHNSHLYYYRNKKIKSRRLSDTGKDRFVARASLWHSAHEMSLAEVYAVLLSLLYPERLHFVVRTYHHTLRWILTFKESIGHLAKWRLQFLKFVFAVVHRPRMYHGAADAVLQLPQMTASLSDTKPAVNDCPAKDRTIDQVCNYIDGPTGKEDDDALVPT